MSLLAAAFASLQSSPGFEVPEGFSVRSAAAFADSFLSLAFGPDGSLYLGVEDRPILVAKDADKDGVYETKSDFAAEPKSCQGLVLANGVLWATGTEGGKCGLFRVAPDKAACVLELRPGGEHGAHGIALGPDGFLYLTVGDHSGVVGEPKPSLVLADGYEGNLLHEYPDPNGHGLQCRYPHGLVARVDPKDGSFALHSVGYRNAYDLAFDAGGELFTVDSDMEWDVGLPWYRPVRVLHCVEGGDYGSRRGSSPFSFAYPDALPPAAEIGRGSPTGVAFCTSRSFPARFRGALLVADWSQGRILAVHLDPEGATFAGTVETLLSAKSGCPITDLAFAPDGSLVFATGGRGTVGRVYRLACDAPQPPSLERAIVRIPRKPPADPYAALGDPDRWVRYEARTILEHAPPAGFVEKVLAEKDPLRRREGLLLLARARLPGATTDLVLEKLGDPAASIEDLRVAEVAILRLGEASDGAREKLVQLLLAARSSDAPRAREIECLLAHLAPERAIDPILAHLSDDREEAIHAGMCASTIEHGWSAKQATAMLRWYETTAAWTGGASFQGYLASMRSSFLHTLDAPTVAAAAAAEGSGPLALAWIAAERPECATPEIWKTLGARLASADDPLRGRVLGVIATSKDPAAKEILRASLDGAPEVRDAALLALCETAGAEDVPVLVRALSNPSPTIPAKCAEALARVGRAPEDPADLAAALDAAHRLGSLRARKLIEVLVGWASLPPLGAEPSGAEARVQEYKSSLASLETWFATTYPKFERKIPDVARGPSWEQDAILAFLTRSAARKGSPARGREVFARATCARCHLLEGDAQPPATDPQAFHGPDLTTAARRFDDAALLEAIVQPSRAISDQYRNLVVVTDEDERVDGRLVVEEPSGLTLLLSDGTKRTIERAHVASSRPSDVSPMPEGLIANLTLEDVKDLFAYLRAEGRVDPADAAKPGWHDVLSGKKHVAWIYDPAVWKAKDGVLIGKGEQLPKSQYLMSRETFSDFEIEFDVRMAKGNSGFQYRSRVEPGNPDPIGLQADIGQGYWGSLYSSDGRGTIGPSDPKQWVPVLDREGWNHFFVHVEGDRHVIELNGLTTVDMRDATFASGVLGFQVHQGMTMQVTYANVRMRDLR